MSVSLKQGPRSWRTLSQCNFCIFLCFKIPSNVSWFISISISLNSYQGKYKIHKHATHPIVSPILLLVLPVWLLVKSQGATFIINRKKRVHLHCRFQPKKKLKTKKSLVLYIDSFPFLTWSSSKVLYGPSDLFPGKLCTTGPCVPLMFKSMGRSHDIQWYISDTGVRKPAAFRKSHVRFACRPGSVRDFCISFSRSSETKENR